MNKCDAYSRIENVAVGGCDFRDLSLISDFNMGTAD
jgi:hypothetical protein